MVDACRLFKIFSKLNVWMIWIRFKMREFSKTCTQLALIHLVSCKLALFEITEQTNNFWENKSKQQQLLDNRRTKKKDLLLKWTTRLIWRGLNCSWRMAFSTWVDVPGLRIAVKFATIKVPSLLSLLLTQADFIIWMWFVSVQRIVEIGSWISRASPQKMSGKRRKK